MRSRSALYSGYFGPWWVGWYIWYSEDEHGPGTHLSSSLPAVSNVNSKWDHHCNNSSLRAFVFKGLSDVDDYENQRVGSLLYEWHKRHHIVTSSTLFQLSVPVLWNWSMNIQGDPKKWGMLSIVHVYITLQLICIIFKICMIFGKNWPKNK